MLGGIIAGALRGASDAYGEVAKSEFDKQQKIDYQQRILEMTEEKERRLEEFRSDLKVRDIPRVRSAEAQATADNAPVLARGQAAGEAARFAEEAKLGLPQMRADSEMSAYNAGKPKRDAEADEKIDRAITDVTRRAGDPKYVEGIRTLDSATAAGELDIARERGAAVERAADIRSAGGGGRGSGKTGDGSPTGIDLERAAKGSKRLLATALGVPENKIDEEYGRVTTKLQRQAQGGDTAAQQRLAEIEQYRDVYVEANRALQQLNRKGGASKGGSEGADSAGPAANAKGASGSWSGSSSSSSRPPLSNFWNN